MASAICYYTPLGGPFSLEPGSIVALPGVVVHHVWPNTSRRGRFGVRFGLMPLNLVIRAFPLVCLSSANWATPFIIIIGCSEGRLPMSPCARTTTRLRVFVSQASSMDRCGQCSDTRLSSPAPASLGSPWSVQQHDIGAESPHKARRTSCWVRPTRAQDLSAGVLSPVSNQAPGAMFGCGVTRCFASGACC